MKCIRITSSGGVGWGVLESPQLRTHNERLDPAVIHLTYVRIQTVLIHTVHGSPQASQRITLCNTSRCKKSVTNMGIKMYNNLPFEIETTQNFKAFKRKLKDYLLLNAFYSLKEFFN
jgi:hypothetical protein